MCSLQSVYNASMNKWIFVERKSGVDSSVADGRNKDLELWRMMEEKEKKKSG